MQELHVHLQVPEDAVQHTELQLQHRPKGPDRWSAATEYSHDRQRHKQRHDRTQLHVDGEQCNTDGHVDVQKMHTPQRSQFRCLRGVRISVLARFQ